ncbi:MAG: DUF2194 domain-containing protein [Actinomycetia bacterium]|nr:DUF2194 domain-containing protein [Actinomycetes bacterium]
MLFKKIMIILTVLLILATGFQVIRTLVFARFIKNTNELGDLPEPVSASIPDAAVFDKYLILSDAGENNSTATLEQIEKTLEYMKKDYDSLDISNTGGIDPGEYDCIIFSFERLDFLGDLVPYMDFVRDGGSLVFAVRPIIDQSFRDISSLLAISSFDGMEDNAKGIRIDAPLLIGIDDEFENTLDSIQNSSIDAKLDIIAGTRLYLSTFNGIPLLWQTDYGKGRFVIFNGTMLNEKSNRGVLTALISRARDTIVYPIANIKMVHIDDFPAPIPRGTDRSIMEEFNRTIPQFYREVWWSDMTRLAKKYGLKYSGFVIENYGDNTEPPFEITGRLSEENMLVYGKELLNLGGEIGLHGYNHQSLAPEGYIKQDLGYNCWAGQEDMEESIETLIGFIHGVFKNYSLRAYVPPSNILSDMGRSAVIAANEELEVIASVYLPNREGDVYYQEFEVAPDGIIEFPRISSGYHYTPNKMWAIYNALNIHGIFSHFVHPDDILDPDRCLGRSWSEISKDFELIISDIDRNYSWLNSYTVSEGARELIKYIEINPHIEYSDDVINIYCENFRPDAYFVMRTDKNISGSNNIEYEKIDNDAYILILKEPYGFIELEDE